LDKNNPTVPAIETNTTYTTDENYTSTVTDETRNTTTLSNDTQVGTLQWLQAPNDTTSTRTTYSYDSIYRAAGVSKPVPNLFNGVSQMQAAYTYEDDQIKTISHNTTSSSNDTTYTFNYGDMRLLSSIQVGSGTPRTLVSNSYVSSDRSYNLQRSTYGNGDWVQYSYDNLDRVIGILFDNDSTNRFAVTYNNAGDVASLTDSANNLFTKHLYDMSDRLKGVTETGISGRNYSHYYSWAFDNNRSVTSFKEILNGSTWTTDYSLDSDNRLSAASYTYGTRSSSTNWTYDAFGRVSARNISDNGAQIFDTDYTFIAPDSTHTSNLVATLRNKRHTAGGYDRTMTYLYDANGNITSISDGTNPVTYGYDGANQLVRENNSPAGKTWSWTYDAGGNIREKREYSYTLDADLTGKTNTLINYGYTDSNGWGDLLTSYNGASITYDGMGNPLTDGTWTYTWEGGRNLVGLSKTGTNISYTYNMDGIRTSKTVNGVTTTYTLVGDRVTQESDGTDTIYYRYDNADSLISMNLDGTEFYYVRNGQNDIVGLANSSGDVIVQYIYDAWGNTISLLDISGINLGVINSYRYRGYRYDTETNFYYLNSRYYSPSIERFVNSDIAAIILLANDTSSSINQFAYCLDNPVMNVDPSGYLSVSVQKISNGLARVLMSLSDYDIRQMKYANSMIFYTQEAGIGVAILATAGTTAVVLGGIGIALAYVNNSISAGVDRDNYGKGATVEFIVRITYYTYYYPIWKTNRMGSYMDSFGSSRGVFFWLASKPIVRWNK
jgi:RHS repeat-associated protein